MNAPDAPVLVLLAAGASRRFGTQKQTAMLAGAPLLRRATQAAVATGLPVTVVVHAGVPASLLAGLPLDRVDSPDPSRGLGSSIAHGARHVAARYPHAASLLLCLADQPLVDARALERVLAVHREEPARIVAATYAGTRGPPCLFPADLFPDLQALDGDRGARDLLVRHAGRVRVVELPEAALDIDTPGDLARAEAVLGGAPPELR